MPGPYGWASLGAHVREVAIHISNHTMRIGDRGVVVVGGSVELGRAHSGFVSLKHPILPPALACSSYYAHL